MKSLLKKILPWRLVNLFWHLPKSILASFLHGFPAHKLTCIAVAGTKGKTSTAYFLSQILDQAGIRHILLSTAALKIGEQEQLNPIKLTSPTPFFLQEKLRQSVQEGCTHAIIEVSSHAIKQYRIWGVVFDIVVITNLMSDHLEYHADSDEYRTIHKQLISPKTKFLVLNTDDPDLESFKSLSVRQIPACPSSPDYTKLKSMPIPVPGDYNLMNILCAAKAAQALSIPRDCISQSLSTLRPAPGRMEYIREGQSFDVIVDYAHSVDSLTAFFHAIRECVSGSVIAVFGACGDRDPAMRPLMGKVLDEYADSIIVTTDDTYTEDPASISTQVLSGITRKDTKTLFSIPDRRTAIEQALSLAHNGDTVCILGKGAETMQILGNKKLPWDDRAVARDLLRANREQKQAH